MTLSALAGPRSCVASARTATVMVCVPALPPIEATIGISTASATICSMVASNRLITREARMAVTRLASSQVKRCLVVRHTEFGHQLAGHAAHPQNVFRGFFLHHLDHVVGGNHADQPAAAVDDGRGGEIVALELARHRLLIGLDRNGDGCPAR